MMIISPLDTWDRPSLILSQSLVLRRSTLTIKSPPHACFTSRLFILGGRDHQGEHS